ncbi:MAG TPA: class I SAM-dependent methyltransferase [Actinomycetota bacterium]|nr:class I SAM-dependent methyltransferase [Actinomycetota bacterium]
MGEEHGPATYGLDEEYGPATYGDRIADVFDRAFVPDDARDAARFLAAVAGPGPALELGIGTGRVALPLQRLGVEVHGIEASERMLERLRAKRGGREVPVTVGDFTTARAPGHFSLVYVVFNTIFAPLTQEDQLRCFANVAGHLRPGGLFVVEAFVPDLARFDRGQRTEAFEVGVDRVRLDVVTHDPVEQLITGSHVVITEEGVKLYPFRMRYAWPSELDLMARLAGLRLRKRYGGWRREPFTWASDRHVSVYERPRRSR